MEELKCVSYSYSKDANYLQVQSLEKEAKDILEEKMRQEGKERIGEYEKRTAGFKLEDGMSICVNLFCNFDLKNNLI